LLTEHRQALEAIAKALLEYETLDGSQIRDIIKTGRMQNPPTISSKPPKLPPVEGAVVAPEPEYPGGLTEATA
jgi:cell division protease FtsH